MAGQWDEGVFQGATQPLWGTQFFCVVRSLRTCGCGCFQTCSRIALTLGSIVEKIAQGTRESASVRSGLHGLCLRESALVT